MFVLDVGHLNIVLLRTSQSPTKSPVRRSRFLHAVVWQFVLSAQTAVQPYAISRSLAPVLHYYARTITTLLWYHADGARLLYELVRDVGYCAVIARTERLDCAHR